MRKHPIDGFKNAQGIDFCSYNTYHGISDGVVKSWLAEAGNCVVIRHSPTYQTEYTYVKICFRY